MHLTLTLILTRNPIQTKLRLKTDVMKQQERLLGDREQALVESAKKLQATLDDKVRVGGKGLGVGAGLG